MDDQEFRKFLIDSGLSENTARAYVSNVKKFEWYLLKYKDKGLQEANPRDIKDFARWGIRGFGRTSSINSYLYGIHKYYEYQDSEEMRNTIKQLPRYKRPKPTARPDLINWGDFQKSMEDAEKIVIRDRDRALLNLLWSRMSPKEILQLKLSDIDFEKYHIKSRISGTKFYLTERAWKALEKYIPIEKRGKKKSLFSMSMRTLHHITRTYFGKSGQTPFKLGLSCEREITEEGEKRIFRVLEERTQKSETEVGVLKRKREEELVFPIEILEKIPLQVRRTVEGIEFNYQNNFPDFCFWGMRKALIDAIRIRFIKGGKVNKLYDDKGNAHKLLKWIEYAKQERYINPYMARNLSKEVKVFGDAVSHDYMTDLQKEEVPPIFKHLRLALARMYYKEG